MSDSQGRACDFSGLMMPDPMVVRAELAEARLARCVDVLRKTSDLPCQSRNGLWCVPCLAKDILADADRDGWTKVTP